jgi:hypothetical protein
MWETSEGDTKFLYVMKLVPPKDLGSTIHRGIVHLALIIENIVHSSIID